MAKRETLDEAGYTLHSRPSKNEVVLRDNDNGRLELWFANPGHASYGIVIDGIDFEFARGYTE